MITLNEKEAAECLRLLDNLAAYALDGWIENNQKDDSEEIPEDFKEWATMLDRIRHKVGGKGSWRDDRHLRG